jgi:hypothetical protein
MKHFLFIFDQENVDVAINALGDLHRCGLIVFTHWIVPSKISWYVMTDDIDFDLKSHMPCQCTLMSIKGVPKMFKQLPKAEGIPYSNVIVVPQMSHYESKERFRHFLIIVENDNIDLTRTVMRDLIDTKVAQYIRNTISKSHFYLFTGRNNKYRVKKLWSLINNSHLPFVAIKPFPNPVFYEFEDLYEVGVPLTETKPTSTHFRLYLHDTSTNSLARAWGGFDALRCSGRLKNVNQIGMSATQYYLETPIKCKLEEVNQALQNVFIDGHSLALVLERPFIPVLSQFARTYDSFSAPFFAVGKPVDPPSDPETLVVIGKPLSL